MCTHRYRRFFTTFSDALTSLRPKIMLTYFFAIPVQWVLSACLFNVVHVVLLMRYEAAHEYSIRSDIRSIVTKRGYSHGPKFVDIKPEDVALIMAAIRDELRRVSGLGPTTVISILTFGTTGYLAGRVSQNWTLAGFLPATSLFLNNPLRQENVLVQLPLTQELMVFAFAQLGISYAAAYFGARAAVKNVQTSEDLAT
jgi:hypothetical protein